MCRTSLWQNMKIFLRWIVWWCISALTSLINTVLLDSCRSSSSAQPHLELLPAQYTWNSSYKAVVHDFSHAVFAADACDHVKMAYATASGSYGRKVIVTSDSFRKTSVVLHIQSDFISGEAVLTSLTFVADGLLAAVSRKVFLYDFSNFEANKTRGIDSRYLVHSVYAHDCCFLIDHCQVWGNVVLAYANSFVSDFYYSIDGGRQFLHAVLSSTGQQYKILSSTVLAVDLTALFMTQHKQTSKLVLVAVPLNSYNYTHDLDQGELVHTHLLTEFSSPQSMHMLQLRSNFYSLIFWDNTKLIYRRRLDSLGKEVVVHQRGNQPVFLTNEYIRHTHSSSLGEFLMITSHNRLLYGREGYVTEATYVTSLSAALTDATVAIFSTEGDLLLISPEGTDKVEHYSALFMSTVYLPSEVLRLGDILAPCPYQRIERRQLGHHYLIDIHDSIEFITKIHTSEWSYVSLMVEASAGQSFKITNTANQLPSVDKGVLYVTVRSLIAPADLAYLGLLTSRYSKLSSGRGAAVRVVTTSSSLTCADNSQQVTHISLGCDQGKRLVVNRLAGTCEELAHQYSYNIPADSYDPDYGKYGVKYASIDKLVNYDYRRYGCANKTYYSNPFVFDLHLYRDATYLGPMKGEYVVFERNGMNRFNYSLKVKDSGCRFAPQTWREMRLSAAENTSLDDIWSRSNYRRCNLSYDYLPSGRVFTPHSDDPYEILSYDNGNYLTFTRNGIYLFEIIVVDHDYSFCDLRTHLAVEVFGVQPEVPIGFFWIMGGSCGAGLVVLLIAFAIADVRRRLRQAQEREMDSIEAFENSITQHLSDQEQRMHGLLIPKLSSIVANKRISTLPHRRSARFSLSKRRFSLTVDKLSTG